MGGYSSCVGVTVKELGVGFLLCDRLILASRLFLGDDAELARCPEVALIALRAVAEAEMVTHVLEHLQREVKILL